MPNQYQYSVLRYVPDVIRDESMNVGVLVRTLDGSAFDFKVSPRVARLRALSENIDKSLVRNFESQLLRAKSGQPLERLGLPTDATFFDRALREFNGSLQLSHPRGIVGANMATVLESLFLTYVKDAAAPQTVDVAPARARQRLISSFRRQRLLGPNKVTPDFVVTGKHASWQFDLGYQNHNLHVIRSIALSGQSDEKNLSRALLLKGMCEEIRDEHTDVRSVAVLVSPAHSNSIASVGEAEAILRDADIQVVAANQIDLLLAQVASDLNDVQAQV